MVEDQQAASQDINTSPQNASDSNQQFIDRGDVVELQSTIPSQQDFNLTYELNPVVRRFLLHNPNSFSIYCQIRIIPKTNDFMNFRVPSSTFRVKVRPQSTTSVLTLMKILPEVGWGEYDVESDIQKAEVQGGHNSSEKKKNVQFNIRVVDDSEKSNWHNTLKSLQSSL